MVYIDEAHSSDGWQMQSNVDDKVVYRRPLTFPERAAVAHACVLHIKLNFQALVDDLSNSTERAYTAWPDRLYVIDRQGRIAYKSAPGPFGFKPEELEVALKKLA